MYLLYCLLIWLGVYSFPALALFPRLIYSPKTAFAIPILSAFVIFILSTLLEHYGIFTTTVVDSSALVLSLVAMIRIFSLRKCALFWTKQEAILYLFHLIILLPYFIKLGTHAFDRGDEIYSWNFWALQHYFQEAIDFSHTGAPYPQLLPKLLAFCYHLVGDIDLQLPVKGSLIIFPWSMLTAIAMSSRKKTGLYFGAYLLLLAYVLAGVGLEQFFNDGYADPLMSSALIVSLALLWLSIQKKPPFSSYSLAFFAVIAAFTAFLSKQPGLLWAMFSLPLLLGRQKFYSLALLSFVGGAMWLMGEGREFHHNSGVIWLSSGNRDLLSQLIFSIKKYFIDQPALLLLFIGAGVACYKERTLRLVVLLFMVPSLFCWFVFGAYQLRLGQHLIAMAFFIIVASGYAFPKTHRLPWQFLLKKSWAGRGPILLSIGIGCLAFACAVYERERNTVSLYAGGRQSLERYFAQDAQRIYDDIYTHPELCLWVPSRYLYGLFYKHTQLTSPDYLAYSPYDIAALAEELRRKQPDYVFTVSEDIAHGVASALLTQLIQQCPAAFSLNSNPQQKFSFKTYKVDKTMLQQDICLQQISYWDE